MRRTYFSFPHSHEMTKEGGIWGEWVPPVKSLQAAGGKVPFPLDIVYDGTRHGSSLLRELSRKTL